MIADSELSQHSSPLAREAEGAEECAQTRRSLATYALWTVVTITGLVGAIIPAIGEAATFASGYYYGNDYPIPAFLSTLTLAAFLVLFALANAVFHLRVRWHYFLLALGIQLAFWVAGQAIVNLTFESIVQSCVVRADAAVNAIQSYEHENGCAPRTLKALVPQYFASDPGWIHEEGTTLWYGVTTAKLPVPVGAWAIKPNFLERIGLEYAPVSSTRDLLPNERRIGDWIVDAQGP